MKIFTIKFRNKILVVLFWLLLWQLLSVVVANDIVMVSPYRVIIRFFGLFKETQFYKTIVFSTAKIGAGLLTGLILGVILGEISFKWKIFEELLAPFMSVIKSIPVAAFVVLLLIWAGSSWLSFFISFLIVLPNSYVNSISGIKSTDEKILRMADCFSYSSIEKHAYIIRHSMLPYLTSNMKVTVGLAWKSGVAAELIGMSDFSIGLRIYMSKIYLDTASLFAWTLVTVLLSVVFEKIVISLLYLLQKYKIPSKYILKKASKNYSKDNNDVKDIYIKDINVSFGEKVVLNDICINLKAGVVYALMGPSGIGKTTLLNEIKKRSDVSASMVFQEDILMEDYDALTNIFLGKNVNNIEKVLLISEKILGKENLKEPVRNFSGGMKRRVSVLRALAHNAPLIIMDEPFTGLDDNTKANLIKVINEEKKNRTLIFVTHDLEDAKAMNAQIIRL